MNETEPRPTKSAAPERLSRWQVLQRWLDLVLGGLAVLDALFWTLLTLALVYGLVSVSECTLPGARSTRDRGSVSASAKP